MKKLKAIVYPFDREFCPIIRYKNLVERYEIVELVSLNGWGYIEKDVACVDYGNMTGMIIQTDYSKALECCDTVIFNKSEYYEGMEKDIYLKIKEAIMNRKNVVSLFELDDTAKCEIGKLAEDNNVDVEFAGQIKLNNKIYRSRKEAMGLNSLEYDGKSYIYENLYKLNTPVVFVMGTSENTSKFQIQLAVREKLRNMGYKVSQIGSRNYCELLGFHSFPDFMHLNDLSEVDKIIQFNNYVKYIEEEETPDIIVIGIPGGISKVNNEYTNKFGIYAYEVSQAIEADYVIMSTFYMNHPIEKYDILNTSAKHRFGCEVDCINLTNIQLDWDRILQRSGDIYINLSSNFIDTKIQEYGNLHVPIYNIQNEEHANQMVEDIVNKLSCYAELELI